MAQEQTVQDRAEIVRLMKRIPRRSPLRRLIDAATGEFLRPNEAAPALCAVLNTTPEYRWRERLVAAIALRYAPIRLEEESATVLALGKALQTNYMGRVSVATFRFMICFVAAFAALLVSALLYESTGLLLIIGAIFLAISAFLLLSSPFVLVIAPLLDADYNRRVQLTTAETLARLQFAESAGILAKASRGRKRLADVTRNALVQLLPTLTEAHYGRLPADATPELSALLFDADTSEPLISLTIEALGKVGDGRAVEPVQKFAQTARTPKLREMAADILPILIARREQENAAGTLLRHSSAPPVAASELLRAASAIAATPPEMLLRPSSEIQMSAEDAEDAEK